MTYLEGSAIPWAVVSVHVLGLLSACLARFSEGCGCQKFYRGLFLVFLVLVAGSAIVSMGFEPECWLTSGTILAVMMVAATFPLGRSHKAVAW
ncbi:MAG: hypothetical protein JW719_03845 [Pirellulales bacterium]|nr:hypothetical protein [Pirellulales bacterium]